MVRRDVRSVSTKDCTSPLKVCPFCGGEAKAWEYEDEQDVFDPISLGWIDTRCIVYHCVGCESCEIVISRLSKDDAEAAWNTRAERTCEMVELDDVSWDEYAGVADGARRCSLCGALFIRNGDVPRPNYCPNCGAKVVAE